MVGTGRCGSTTLHRLLGLHDDVGCLSYLNEGLPSQTWLSVFSRAYRWSLPSRVKRMKAFPMPWEAYRFWDHYLPGFSRRDRPLMPEDVPLGGIEPVRKATAKVLRYQGQSRFLLRVNGWSRIAYFDRIYPDALFLHLERDPRSVVSSWIKAGWLDVTSPPDSRGWQWGEVPSAYFEVWERLGGGDVLSAALKTRLDLDDIARNIALFPERSLTVRYEDLVASPEATLRLVCNFTGLHWTSRFRRIVQATRFYDASDKWRRHLGAEQGALISEFFMRTDAIGLSERPTAGKPRPIGV
jgi:hypothetical protein